MSFERDDTTQVSNTEKDFEESHNFNNAIVDLTAREVIV